MSFERSEFIAMRVTSEGFRWQLAIRVFNQFIFLELHIHFSVVSVIIIKRVRHTSVKIQSLITIYNLHLLLLAHVLVRVSANDYDLAKLTLCCKFTIIQFWIFLSHWGKNHFFIQKFLRTWWLKNVNFVKKETLKWWILSKMRLWNCEFCQKWDFEIANFVKNKILKLWFFG